MFDEKELQAFISAMHEHDPALLVHSFGVTNIAWQIAVDLEIRRDLNLLLYGALLHDVGKILIDRSILQKRGPLDPREQELMKCHPVNGAQMLSKSVFAQELKEIVLCHHERWDGKGYLGLFGHYIPFVAQIVSLADALDAMYNDRPYRKALAPLEVLDEVKKCTGTQFSPDLVNRLMQTDFWPGGASGQEKLANLIRRELKWLDYLVGKFRSPGHPLVQVQSTRLGRVMRAYYRREEEPGANARVVLRQGDRVSTMSSDSEAGDQQIQR